MMLALSQDNTNLLYALAFFFMLAAFVFEAFTTRKLTWSLLVSASWATVMFVWWSP